jgi:hypothetical protein
MTAVLLRGRYWVLPLGSRSAAGGFIMAEDFTTEVVAGIVIPWADITASPV